jgi:hypothetical protein
MSVSQRAEHRIPKLRAKLESAESLRLKRHLWGTMERRSRFEAALARAEFVVAQHRLSESSREFAEPGVKVKGGK